MVALVISSYIAPKTSLCLRLSVIDTIFGVWILLWRILKSNRSVVCFFIKVSLRRFFGLKDIDTWRNFNSSMKAVKMEKKKKKESPARFLHIYGCDWCTGKDDFSCGKPEIKRLCEKLHLMKRKYFVRFILTSSNKHLYVLQMNFLLVQRFLDNTPSSMLCFV